MVINSPICPNTKGKVSDSSGCPAGSTCAVPQMTAAHPEYHYVLLFFVQLANKYCPFLMCMLFIFLISTSMTKSN